MNISGVGTPASGALSSQYSTIYDAATSQRLQKLHQQRQQGGYDYAFESTSGIPDKRRLVPSRKREERIAVQNIQYRVELSRLHSSSNEDFMRAVFGRKMTLENVPSFLRKVFTIRKNSSTACINSICDEVIILEFTLHAS
jgi:hypothetical protein